MSKRMLENKSLLGINDIAAHVYQTSSNSGFHENDEANASRFAEFVANLHGEASELWEAYRKGNLNKQCYKDVTLTCAEEELADIIIRALDTAVTLKIDIGRAIAVKDQYNQTRAYKHGGKVA